MDPKSHKMDEVFRDKKKLEMFFARAVPLTEFIEEPRTVSSVVLCPFHGDQSPSAKLFYDEDGVTRLYCFTEHRQYTSYDFVTKVLGEDPRLFLLSRFSQSEMDGILSKVTFTISKRPIIVDLGDDDKTLSVCEFLDKVYSIACPIGEE